MPGFSFQATACAACWGVGQSFAWKLNLRLVPKTQTYFFLAKGSELLILFEHPVTNAYNYRYCSAWRV